MMKADVVPAFILIYVLMTIMKIELK